MKKLLYHSLLIVITILPFTIACNKDNTGIEVNLAYKLIADKTWYLDYSETTNGTTVSTRTFLGQPTYFINYLKSLATTDSDGLVGVYEISKTDTALHIKVLAKTNNGNPSAYTYEIESIGQKSMIMSYSRNNIKTRLFFSTQK